MTRALIKVAIRARFVVTSRAMADAQIKKASAFYLDHAANVGELAGRRRVLVPRMLGVDPDMRNWSFFMILEHNAIVNRSMTAVTASLARGETPSGRGAINPKTDVLPSADPGPEQIEAFRQSVADHLTTVAALESLRGSRTHKHPLFGDFDAHRWHCMLGFHLGVHRKQTALVLREALRP